MTAPFSDYVARLRAENEELLAENTMLRNAMAPAVDYPSDWRLWRRHRIIFGALLARETVAVETLCLLLGDNQNGEPTTDNNVQQLITRMRDRVGPKGVVIRSDRFIGYSLENREHWRKQLLKDAIQAAGSASQLAKELGITPQALSLWKRVPHERVIEVEAISGVDRTVLRPDLYPPNKGLDGSSSNNLSALRRAAGLTQRELADRLEIHWVTVSKLERGVMQMTETWMRSFGLVFGCSPGDLLADAKPSTAGNPVCEWIATECARLAMPEGRLATALGVTLEEARDILAGDRSVDLDGLLRLSRLFGNPSSFGEMMQCMAARQHSADLLTTGEIIRSIRTNVFCENQETFAKTIGVVQSTVSRWQNNNASPSLEDLRNIRAAAVKRGLPWEDGWFFDGAPAFAHEGAA